MGVQLSVTGLYLPPVLKTGPKAYPPQTIISLPVHTALCPNRASGALVVLVVAVQLSAPGLYLPPVLKSVPPGPVVPPQMIISLSVHTAVWRPRASGALVVLVAVQLSVTGLYPPPEEKIPPQKVSVHPPQTIISLSVQTAVCHVRAEGALVVLVAVQLSVTGLYLPPVLRGSPLLSSPPQTIISLPVHTAVFPSRAEGALVVLVAIQLSVMGLYLPPVLWPPPQAIISLPVHTRPPPVGALTVLVAVQLSVMGLYLPPVPPLQTIISLPVHTEGALRGEGALVNVVGVHVSSMQPPEGLAITGSV